MSSPPNTIDPAWPRRPLTLIQRGSLWRQCRNHLAQPSWSSGVHVDYATAIALDNETRPKFFALQAVFWIKLRDFMDIIPQHPHLRDMQFPTRSLIIHEFPFGKGATDNHSGGVPQAAIAGVGRTHEGSPADTSMVNGIQ